MNPMLNRAEVRCLKCGAWSPSAMFIADLQTFETMTASGSSQNCMRCGAMTPCNKENMRFTRTDGKGGFVGNDTTS